METQITLSEEAFVALFRPRKNELKADASYDFGAGGTMYETYGDEHDYVIAQNPAHIWTICSDEGNGDYIASGYHFADRLGYIITRNPVPDGVKITIDIPNVDSDDNVHVCATEFADRVQTVINTVDFASSHSEMDLEYHLYQMLGEAKTLMRSTCADGSLAPISVLHEHMEELEERFSRYETEFKDFLVDMEECDA
jgi:hypothetical protein